MADNPTCASCRWWETESSSCPGVFGECRRNAPIRREDREGVRAYPYPAWPPTSAQDWCGEHAPRVESSDRPDFREVEAARGCLDPESPDASV